LSVFLAPFGEYGGFKAAQRGGEPVGALDMR